MGPLPDYCRSPACLPARADMDPTASRPHLVAHRFSQAFKLTTAYAGLVPLPSLPISLIGFPLRHELHAL